MITFSVVSFYVWAFGVFAISLFVGWVCGSAHQRDKDWTEQTELNRENLAMLGRALNGEIWS